MARARGCAAGRLLFLHGHVRPSDDRGCRSCGTGGLGARGSTTASSQQEEGSEGKKVSDLSCPVGTAGRMPLLACLQHHQHQS